MALPDRLPRRALTAIAPLLLAAAAAAAPAPKRPPRAWQWRDNIDASVLETSGNSVSRTVSGANSLEAMWPRFSSQLKFTALQAKTRDDVTAERFVAFEKLRWHWSDDNYLFEKVLWKRDRFAGLRYRFDASVGLGRRLFRTKRAQFVVEAGGGQILEHEIYDQDHRGDSYKTSSKFTYAFPKGAVFEQDAEYTHNLRKGSDSRHQFVSSLTSPLTSRLSLKTSFEYEFNNAPPPGILRVDRVWQMGITIAFGDLGLADDDAEDYGEIDENDEAPLPDPPAQPSIDSSDDGTFLDGN